MKKSPDQLSDKAKRKAARRAERHRKQDALAAASVGFGNDSFARLRDGSVRRGVDANARSIVGRSKRPK
jgi:hypothetical protein